MSMERDLWLRRCGFGDVHAHEARVTFDTAPTMVNTFTTAQALGLAQGGEHLVKALVYYDNRQPGHHQLVGMWSTLPLAPDIRARFEPFVRDAQLFRRDVPYPDKKGFRVHTEERTVEDWLRFIHDGVELTDFVEQVGAHVRDGAPAPPGWGIQNTLSCLVREEEVG